MTDRPEPPTLQEAVASMARQALARGRPMPGGYWEQHRQADAALDDIGELFHENTKLRAHRAIESGVSAQIFLAGFMIRPSTFVGKTYPMAAAVALPADGILPTQSIGRTLVRRRSGRVFSGVPLDLRHLATVLYAGAGITHHRKIRDERGVEGIDQFFRAAPSGGALYPCECYVLAINVRDVSPGVYHYNVFEHALERLDATIDVSATLIGAFPLHPETVRLDRAGAVVIITAMWARQHAKYGPRAYRYAYQESGHIAQNMLLAATAAGLGSIPMASFYDDRVDRFLGIDGVEESVVYTLAVGQADVGAPGRAVTPADLRRGVVPWASRRRLEGSQKR